MAAAVSPPRSCSRPLRSCSSWRSQMMLSSRAPSSRMPSRLQSRRWAFCRLARYRSASRRLKPAGPPWLTRSMPASSAFFSWKLAIGWPLRARNSRAEPSPSTRRLSTAASCQKASSTYGAAIGQPWSGLPGRRVVNARCGPRGSAFYLLLHPLGIGVDELFQERLDAIAEHAGLLEETAGIAQVSLRLLHHRHVEKHHGLAQVLVGAEAADSARRRTEHGARLAAEGALAVGARADVDGVLHRCRHRTVVFRGDEQQRVGGLELGAKADVRSEEH